MNKFRYFQMSGPIEQLQNVFTRIKYSHFTKVMKIKMEGNFCKQYQCLVNLYGIDMIMIPKNVGFE